MGSTASTRGTRRPLRGLARRFARSDRGVTVIEFAIVGPIFFALIGATIETALAFFAGYALDAAVVDTSRLIRTGQATAISSAETYRKAVCGQLYGVFNCGQLRISVKPIPNFKDFEATDPIAQENGQWTMPVDQALPTFQGSTNYMIEAYYKWPIFFNIPGLNAGQTGDGARLLAAAHVIRTEPF